VGIAIATLIGGEYLAEPESFCDRNGHICFSAIQKPIDLNAINSVLSCKVGLASFPTDRGPQQLNNVTFLKYHRGPRQFAGKRALTFPVARPLRLNTLHQFFTTADREGFQSATLGRVMISVVGN
jgi:hypothetical protein